MLHFIIFIFSLWPGDPQPKLFEEQTIDSLVSIGYGVALGDVDGDKKTDILLADQKQIVWYRNGDWKKFVLAENLTEMDNVCIAAHDIDGDGKVEVAVGAQWNPSETSDTTKSGSVHYLVRPADLNSKWTAITLRHEPTVHRMGWIEMNGRYHLVVLPLHGRNNKGGEGAGVKIYAYEIPSDVKTEWKMKLLAGDMHMPHNFAIKQNKQACELFVAGKEGVRLISPSVATGSKNVKGMNHGAGEVKIGKTGIATIEPMHGNTVAFYPAGGSRNILDTTLKEGHALGVGDFIGNGTEQVIAGWRNPDAQQLVGIRLYNREPDGTWKVSWIDRNGMACEDLQVGDLNNDGKPDIVASGRATKNLKIYWNTSATQSK